MNEGYLFVVIAALTWSSMGLFVRLISLSGLFIYFFAALISALIFASLLIKERKLKDIFTRTQIWILICMSVFNIVNNVTYFYSYKLTTIANATFVHYLAPILIAVLAPLILYERTGKRVWYSVILALVGLFILVKPTTIATNNKETVGILLAFISAIGYAFGVLFSRKATNYFKPKQILFSQMFFSVLILSPVIFYFKPVVQLNDILPLLILGAVHQGIAVLLFINALKLISAQRVSAITYLEPLGATLLALIFIREMPDLFTLIGGAMILAACYLTIKNKD